MNILVLSFFPAFVPEQNGGTTRLVNVYRAVSTAHHVRLLSSTHLNDAPTVVNHSAQFEERRIPKDAHFVTAYQALDACSSGGDVSGPAIAASGQFYTALHEAFWASYEWADIIIHESPFTQPIDILATLDSKLRVYNAYNDESALYRQLHPAATSAAIHNVVTEAENQLIRQSDIVCYCNEQDLLSFRERVPDASFQSCFFPNGMAPVAIKLDLKKQPAHAVFMGSNHPPNSLAAEFIVGTLAPQLPEVIFDIVGSCLPAGSYPANVHRHGHVSVSQKRRLLQQASLALNPMGAGSGSNVKVFEYLAHALPVVSTAFGMRGIEAKSREHYLESSLEAFAEPIDELLRDANLRAHIAHSGHALALLHYSWAATAVALMALLEPAYRQKQAAQPSFVLFLNDYNAWQSVGGGATRTQGMMQAVSTWRRSVLLCFCSSNTLAAQHLSSQITTLSVPMTHDHMHACAELNAQHVVSVNDIVASQCVTLNPVMVAIYAALRKYASHVVLEHCYMAPLIAQWGDRFVYSSQNHELGLKQRLLSKHPQAKTLLARVAELEQFAVGCSAATVAVSAEDAQALVKNRPSASQVVVIRNGASMPCPPTAHQAFTYANEFERSAVFLGSAHMPNIEAAQFIVRHLAPACPTVRFHLLGSVSDALTHVPINVTCWGVVDDATKSRVLRSCQLAINPMQSGSGSNVKLADYLGHGLFVLTTPFGQRGYPEAVMPHLSIVPDTEFAQTLMQLFAKSSLFSEEARTSREHVFMQYLTMPRLAQDMVPLLQSLDKRRHRVLYVAYRYCSPAMGGCEVNIEQFLTALSQSDRYEVDVVAPELTRMENHWRFTEHYLQADDIEAATGMARIRYCRFPLSEPSPLMSHSLRSAWQAQPAYERAVWQQLSHHQAPSGLLWGWSDPEGALAIRWSFCDSAVYLAQATDVYFDVFCPQEATVTFFQNGMIVGGPLSVSGTAEIRLQALSGVLSWQISTEQAIDDPRPLGMMVRKLMFGPTAVDLSLATTISQCLQQLIAGDVIECLGAAALSARSGVALSDCRGPFSSGLEAYIDKHISDYDLVITHNSVFRPAVKAIEAAARSGVPSILIPHAHLDDDFYHFPDVLEAARQASRVLAAPRIAVDFLQRKGCNAHYLSAGFNAHDQASASDIDSFMQLYKHDEPFVLVLGRKASAKGYGEVITAVERLRKAGAALRVVMIGPDDDGQAVTSAACVYLSRQPRAVVRGALATCHMLVNMSRSESFGIVLLEAWQAGAPVIVNTHCAAFHDLAVDNVNALMVTPNTLEGAIERLLSDGQLSKRLVSQGRAVASQYDWSTVAAQFLTECDALVADVEPRDLMA